MLLGMCAAGADTCNVQHFDASNAHHVNTHCCCAAQCEGFMCTMVQPLTNGAC